MASLRVRLKTMLWALLGAVSLVIVLLALISALLNFLLL